MELITICAGLDALLKGSPSKCTDILCQRLKSIEASMSGTHWSVAQRLELTPQEAQCPCCKRRVVGGAEGSVRRLKGALPLVASRWAQGEVQGQREGGRRDSEGQRKREEQQGQQGEAEGRLECQVGTWEQVPIEELDGEVDSSWDRELEAAMNGDTLSSCGRELGMMVDGAICNSWVREVEATGHGSALGSCGREQAMMVSRGREDGMMVEGSGCHSWERELEGTVHGMALGSCGRERGMMEEGSDGSLQASTSEAQSHLMPPGADLAGRAHSR